MKIIVIGGSGHIGSFLVPRLVRAGHEVINISRGTRTAYTDAPEWRQVRQVVADREHEDRDGTFGDRVAGLRPDAVVDLVCFTLESATALVERAARARSGTCCTAGRVWRYGQSRKLPIAEGPARARAPFGEYGIQKDRIARMLKEETASGGLVTTSLHPGHIVGPGWHPIGPLGNLDPAVWAHALGRASRCRSPGIGAELMHHVHADDVAQAFERAIEHRDAAAGEDFNVVAPTALNVRGYADIAAAWFGQTATLEPVTWEEFRTSHTPEYARVQLGAPLRSHCFTIEKAEPRWATPRATSPSRPCSNPSAGSSTHDELDVARPLTGLA